MASVCLPTQNTSTPPVCLKYSKRDEAYVNVHMLWHWGARNVYIQRNVKETRTVFQPALFKQQNHGTLQVFQMAITDVLEAALANEHYRSHVQISWNGCTWMCNAQNEFCISTKNGSAHLWCECMYASMIWRKCIFIPMKWMLMHMNWAFINWQHRYHLHLHKTNLHALGVHEHPWNSCTKRTDCVHGVEFHGPVFGDMCTASIVRMHIQLEKDTPH